MEIIIADNYASLSGLAASQVITGLQQRAFPLFCAASGDSPLGLYKELVKRKESGKLETGNWSFLSLDEWLGMNKEDEGSCGYFINQQLIQPLKPGHVNCCFFDGRALDTEKECQRVESYIQEKGGIDVAVVGLGMNGHIGLNEPGTAPTLRAHVSLLDQQTALVGQKYFNNPTPLTHGITLGLATLMEAKKIILIVSGAKKAGIVQKLVEGPETIEIPATQLLRHPSFTLMLDNDAASLLKK
jgi:glucosamine-6-phosphate isomerase